MENDTIATLRLFQGFTEEVSHLLILCRANSVLEAIVHRCHSELARLAETKKTKADAQLEEDANALLSSECTAMAIAEHAQCLLALKNDDGNEAWTHLVSAQAAVRRAIRAHPVAAGLAQYQNSLAALEQCCFPKMQFMSIGVLALESICSLCKTRYGDCDHFAGFPYNGEFCTRVITKSIADHVALVDEPANRHCRVTSFHDGVSQRDWITWATIETAIAEPDTGPPPASPLAPGQPTSG